MFSKNSKERGYKGSVSIISSNGRLQLRFHYGGKRHYLSTGLLDTPANRKLAEFKAAEIDREMVETDRLIRGFCQELGIESPF